MFYFYILKSTINKSFYFGSSSNLKKRLSDHNKGKCKSTKNGKPYELIYYEAYIEKRLAIKRELHIKKSGKERDSLLKRLNQI